MSAPFKWTRKNLLGLRQLDRQEIEHILETAKSFRDISLRPVKKVPALRGKTVANLFFEPSTRTRISFELAEKRLSADTLHIASATSSVVKGETLKDTCRNIESLKVDVVVIRHPSSGAPHRMARHLNASVINAGDGLNGVRVPYNLDEAVEDADVVNLLRIQLERQSQAFFPSIREYATAYQINSKVLKKAKSDVLIMHPGPVNRGIEITSDVVEGPYAVILDQVTYGLAVRMAVLYLLSGTLPEEGKEETA